MAGLTFTVIAGDAARAGEVSVSDAFAHVLEDPVNGRRVEVYMNIENTGTARERLFAVRSKLSRKTMLAVVQDGGQGQNGAGRGTMGRSGTAMHMQAAVLDIPAGATTALEHGGSHIMLMEPKDTPAVGSTFPVTLFFEQAGRVSVEVTVEAIEAGH